MSVRGGPFQELHSARASCEWQRGTVIRFYSGDDDDEEGSEDTPSEDTDADGDVDGATRRDKAGGAPSARTRQSPRLAELEANGAAGTTTPRVPNTTTHRSGDE